jgi:hypothetical protein
MEEMHAPSEDDVIHAEGDLATIAALLNMPKERVRDALDSAPQHYSVDCLKFHEIETFDILPPDRLQHAESCPSCRELVRSMNIAPSHEQVAAFNELAAPNEGRLSRAWRTVRANPVKTTLAVASAVAGMALGVVGYRRRRET